jgi:hypothetical protein
MGMTVPTGNMGDSQLLVSRSKQLDQHSGLNIFLETFNDLFGQVPSNKMAIVSKIDIQGSECRLFNGMNARLAEMFHRMKTEFSPKHLLAQGCSPDKYAKISKRLGFCEDKEKADRSAGRHEWDAIFSRCS